MQHNHAAGDEPPVTTLFIANRAEIAERIIRTAREMGVRTAVGYSDADRTAGFAALADEAFSLDGASAASTYMNAEKLLDAARRAEADALHPGYGFLSENPDFARATVAAGLTWIGPSAEAIEAVGDKISARRLAAAAGVPPVPGVSQPIETVAQVLAFASAHGFPLVIKQADGGGGRGITVIENHADVESFFATHRGHPSAFFVEKLVRGARHVETQCARDAYGNFAILSTRDCSVQRRNQKLIEEAPAPQLTYAQEEALSRYSRNLFDEVSYQGLGTCEFLIAGDDVFFLEINPRLQVEHTVSEEVTGVDAVALQLEIARGRVLPEIPAPPRAQLRVPHYLRGPARRDAPGRRGYRAAALAHRARRAR
ncbi:ATP-binding protein [Corynebacterium atypicum]|uniref:ATP-binding protein n=1 Tax=Corynebacterium atypicum TaxID=191610 RepID=UPI000B0F7BDD|nr:biotin carboxylase N-terminal domain-containing protein [Corynebacterium atypicum]